MSSYTGLSPKNPNKYTGPVNLLSSVVTRNRRPTSADYRQPETGKIYPTSSFWLIGPDPTTGTQGELWYLSKIVANVAYWIQLNAGGGASGILQIDVPAGVTPIDPDGTGLVTFTSTGGTITITGSAANPNNNFINFDLAGGLPPVNSIQVDDFLAPGTNPVVPTAGGLFTFTSEIVANQMIPIQTYSDAANEFKVQVQYGTDSAVSNAQLSGMVHFDDTQFTVDAAGFVQLTGVSAAVDSFGVQATSGGGTDPVLPDGGGQVELEGALVAAGTNPLRSVSTAANTVQYQVQTSQALAAEDSTKVGMSNFDSTKFTVSAGGFVSLVSTGTINNVVIQTFTSSGTYTPTSGMAYCIVEMVGGGGGGGGSASTSASQLAYGGGGGGGEYSRGVFTSTDIGVSKVVTIGAGGSGGVGNASGTTGGTTSLGVLQTAIGGSAGSGAAALGTGVFGSAAGGLGGTGGSGGSFRFAGNAGETSLYNSGAFQQASRGGSSFFSGGTRRTGGGTSAGIAGTGYGGGGSGSSSFVSAATQTGGAGSSGLVVITEYCT